MKSALLIPIGLLLCSGLLCQPALAPPGDETTSEANFQGLGTLPGTDSSIAVAVSGDGRVVIGTCLSGSTLTACRWVDGVWSDLGALPPALRIIPMAVSRDGSVIVGIGYFQHQPFNEAFRWTPSEGMVGLGLRREDGFESRANGVSADGSIVVGYDSLPASDATEIAFLWNLEAGFSTLGTLSGCNSRCWAVASAVSADGSVIVGSALSAVGSQAFRWTQAEGMLDLGSGGLGSRAPGVSADGSVVVGQSHFANQYHAFRWTQSNGMIDLGDLSGGTVPSYATATSADGQVIVGSSIVSNGQDSCPDCVHDQDPSLTMYRAFIWDAAHGMRNLHDTLTNDYGLELTGWKLNSATGVSDDGRTIVGDGTNPDGHGEAWIVRLPAPAQ